MTISPPPTLDARGTPTEVAKDISLPRSKATPQDSQKEVYLCAQVLGHVQLFVTPWTVSCQFPLSMGFSRQAYWSGLPCPPLGDLSDTGIEPRSLVFPALAGRFFTTSTIWEA